MLDGNFLQFVFANYGSLGIFALICVVAILKSANPINSAKKVFNWFGSTRTVHYSPHEILESKLEYWINFKINNIKLNDPGRQLLFRDILDLKFRQFQQYVIKANASINESMSGPEMFQVVVEQFNGTIDTYQHDAIKRGVPDVVIDKFAEWQLRSYEFTLRATEMICMSQGYGTNDARMQAIYSLITAMMELTIAEAEKTLTELNGELTGVVYKGITCG